MTQCYYANPALAVETFALNIYQPTLPVFISSVFLTDSGSSAGILLVVLLSSLFQAYVTLCVGPITTIFAGHIYLFGASITESLRAQM